MKVKAVNVATPPNTILQYRTVSNGVKNLYSNSGIWVPELKRLRHRRKKYRLQLDC
jgi:hypothetical protein